MKQAIEKVIQRFGGIRPMARALGRASTPGTFQYWKRKGFLPRHEADRVERALVESGMNQRAAKVLVRRAVLGESQRPQIQAPEPASKFDD